MSALCGATEKLLELTESIGTTDELMDKLVDKLPITPAQGQSIQDAIAIIAMASDAAAVKAVLTEKLKAYIPEIELSVEIQGLQADVRSVVTKVVSAVDSAENIANDIETLKTKYSGLDLGDVDLQDIPNLLKDGALDLNNLCQKIANWEETELGGFVLKGIPITTPTLPPEVDIIPIIIPETKEPVYTTDPEVAAEEGQKSFINVELPDTIGI
jgi:hypothetical protein